MYRSGGFAWAQQGHGAKALGAAIGVGPGERLLGVKPVNGLAEAVAGAAGGAGLVGAAGELAKRQRNAGLAHARSGHELAHVELAVLRQKGR